MDNKIRWSTLSLGTLVRCLCGLSMTCHLRLSNVDQHKGRPVLVPRPVMDWCFTFGNPFCFCSQPAHKSSACLLWTEPSPAYRGSRNMFVSGAVLPWHIHGYEAGT
ncbi:hypothetical protein BDR06DRAFT_489047 [Suillus hirtellus]|nr:hypothetical protein BDR06DRAFT_489047 [Suillus hirtellus]